MDVRRRNDLTRLLFAAVGAGLFLLLSVVRLDSQGLYSDELFQATGSFAYVGRSPTAALAFHGIPVLNISYVGAIKTAVYGLYLRLSGNSFSVISWRLVGIGFVCIALFWFGLLVRRKLPLTGLLSFYFLILTDVTVLMTARFDWGPVALALSFRLILIALWVEGELSNELRARNSFWLGGLVGISIFEKLSAVTLMFPLLLMIILSPQRRNLRHILASAIGGLFGAVPLILANLYSFHKYGRFASLQLQRVFHFRILSFGGFFTLLKEYLSLGAGALARGFILGTEPQTLGQVELVLLSAILVLMIAAMILSRPIPVMFRLSGIMLLCYGTILVVLYLLPASIWIHHWVIGTPFQYAAIALFLSGWAEVAKRRGLGVFTRYAIFVPLALFFCFRLFSLASVEQALLRGEASSKWDPSLTEVGEFAASKSKDAIFIAGDWGVWGQMICFLNGQPGVVYQPNWANHGVEQVLYILQHTHRSELYFVFPNPPYLIKPETETAVLQEVEQALAPKWREQPVDQQLAGLRSVVVVKLQKVPPP